MPKRGSSTSGTTTVVPHKKSKKTQSTNGHENEEQDENSQINYSSYSSQLFKKSPDVSQYLNLCNTNFKKKKLF